MTARSSAIVAAALAIVAVGTTARAADDSCFAPAVEGQKLERAGKLLDAQARFVTCGQPACDPAVVEKCAGWLGGVEKKIPSVSLAIRDAEGRDVTVTRATIDGADAPAAIAGRAVDVDPGPHRFAAWVGGRELTETIIVREGEKGRVVLLHVSPPDGAAASRSSPSPAMLSASVAFGGLAIASGVVFAIFSAKGLSDRATFGCDAGCAPGHFDTVHNEFIAADVALGVALGSLAIATTLFVLRPRSPAAPTALGPIPLRLTF